MKASQLTAICLLLHVFIQIECQTPIARCGLAAMNSNALLSGSPSNHHWPWHAAIFYKTDGSDLKYRCGGTVISPKLILTAAACVQVDANDISVSLGSRKLDVNEDNAQTYKVEKVIVHPDFDPRDNNNDIAIIKLSTNLIFNDYVQPVCLWNSSNTDFSEIAGKLGTVVGWEATETGESSYKLQELEFPVVDHLTCLKSSPSYFALVLRETNFCAGHRNGHVLKPGFNGGSMTFVKDGIYYIRGIMSLCLANVDQTTGQVTCDSQYAVFTDVAPFLPWIAETVAENDK